MEQNKSQQQTAGKTSWKPVVSVITLSLGVVFVSIGLVHYILWSGWLGANMLIVYYRLDKYLPDQAKNTKQLLTEGFLPPVFYASFACWLIYVLHLFKGGA